jgi:hypothetical protein
VRCRPEKECDNGAVYGVCPYVRRRVGCWSPNRFDDAQGSKQPIFGEHHHELGFFIEAPPGLVRERLEELILGDQHASAAAQGREQFFLALAVADHRNQACHRFAALRNHDFAMRLGDLIEDGQTPLFEFSGGDLLRAHGHVSWT